MKTLTISERGQVTILAAAREQLGLHQSSRLRFRITDGVMLLEPLPDVGTLKGAFGKYARRAPQASWETQREKTARLVAEEAEEVPS